MGLDVYSLLVHRASTARIAKGVPKCVASRRPLRLGLLADWSHVRVGCAPATQHAGHRLVERTEIELRDDDARDQLLRGYEYSLIDEHQDIDEAQYALVSASAGSRLADPDARVSIMDVGDNDQNRPPGIELGQLRTSSVVDSQVRRRGEAFGSNAVKADS